jgi:hypothetical protein
MCSMICDRFVGSSGCTWLDAAITRNVLATGEAKMKHNGLRNTYGRYNSGDVSAAVQLPKDTVWKRTTAAVLKMG